MRNDLPPDVDAFFARAFHRDLDARFANAKELAQGFEAAIGVSSTMHSTPSGVALMTYGGTALPTVPEMRRKRWPLWVAAACAATLGVAAVAFVAGRYDHQDDEASPAVQPREEVAPTAEPAPPAPTASVTASAVPSVLGVPSASAVPMPMRALPRTRPVPEPKDGKSPTPDDEREEKAAKTLGI